MLAATVLDYILGLLVERHRAGAKWWVALSLAGNIGIEVAFETLESAAWTQRWRSGQWEGIVSAWFLPADPSVTGLYACDGPNNMTGLCTGGRGRRSVASRTEGTEEVLPQTS